MISASALSVVVFFNQLLLLLCYIVCASPSLLYLVFATSQPGLYLVVHTQMLGRWPLSLPHLRWIGLRNLGVNVNDGASFISEYGQHYHIYSRPPLPKIMTLTVNASFSEY